MLRIRRGIDGSYWIPRKDKETENWLDRQYIRVGDQLKWHNKLPNMLSFFHNCHSNTTAAIIGKGISLDILKAKHLKDHGCIIAINESVLKIEDLDLDVPLYGTQLDHTLGETCRPSKLSTKLFCGPRCANLYDEGVTKLLADPTCFGLTESCISAVYAIALARHMGCIKVNMFAFDGCLKSNYDYARCIGYPSSRAGSPLRFASHRQLIETAAKNIALDWVIIKGEQVSLISKLL